MANSINVIALIFAALALFLWMFSVWVPWLNGPPFTYPEQPNQQPVAASCDTDHGWHRQEREHKRAERFYWRFSLVLTLAGLISAVTAAAIAYGAYNATTGQLTAMRDDQRAWVYADVASDGNIYQTQEGGLGFPLKFTFHNTGHFPAMAVFPDLVGRLAGEDGNASTDTVLRGRQREECDKPSTAKVGVTVFPGQSAEFKYAVSITPKQIAAMMKFTLKITGNPPTANMPWGIGCIRYQFPDGTSHQTGVVFTMVQNRDDGAYALPGLPADDIGKPFYISPWVTADTAYAN